MYLSININITLILILIICLLNMNSNFLIIKGGNSTKELELYKKLELDINSLKTKISEIDSQININKITITKHKNMPFKSSVRTKMFELQIIIKNLINEKENTINILEKSLIAYNKLLTGGKQSKKRIDPLDRIKNIQKAKLNKLKHEPVLNTTLLSDSKSINDKMAFEMTDYVPAIKEQTADVVTHIKPTKPTNTDESILIDSKSNILVDITSSEEDITSSEEDTDEDIDLFNNSDNDSDYGGSIIENQDMGDEYTNSITKNMSMESFSDFTQQLISSNSNSIR